MKFTLSFFKKAGIFFMVLGVLAFCSNWAIDGSRYLEVAGKCLGAMLFVVGGTALVYSNEKENHNNDVINGDNGQ